MTDTTDIAALREKYTLALKNLTERLVECNRLNYCGDELSAFAAFSSTVIDQLEAERQRADNANDGWVNVIAERDAAEQKSRNYEQVAHGLAAELAALKLEINWPVSQKVRAALDRAACPDAFMRIAVEACTEALKGDQVPVAYLYSASFERGEVEGQLTDAPGCDMPVYDRPQKPVVLPKSHYVCGCADRYMSEKEVKAAIEAAGGIVKDGE